MKKDTYTFLSADGQTDIHVTRWLPDKTPTAVLQLVHGMVEFIERYDDFARYLNAAGIIVIGHDHLGHGRSIQNDALFGHFGDNNGAQHLLTDVDTIVKNIQATFPELPHFILGHSMGSYVLRSYLLTYETHFAGAIIMGTGWQPQIATTAGKAAAKVLAKIHTPSYRAPFIDQLAFGGYNRRFQPAITNKDWLTRDEQEVQAYINSPYTQFIFSVQAYYDLFTTVATACDVKRFKHLQKGLPLLVISGMDDPVGSFSKGVQTLVKSLEKYTNNPLDVQLYPEARHEILNETNKAEVYADVLHWLEKQQ